MNKIWALTLLLAGLTARAESATKSGVYWVPVGQQLSDFALFTLPKVEVEMGADKVKLTYSLPRELTGTLNVVKLEGPRVKSGALVLKGDNARMECAVPDSLTNCTITYHDLTFDATARTSFLQSISRNDEELRKRELVAARFQFGGEPHGLLSVLDETPSDDETHE